jgi:hypothetical protein
MFGQLILSVTVLGGLFALIKAAIPPKTTANDGHTATNLRYVKSSGMSFASDQACVDLQFLSTRHPELASKRFPAILPT